MCFSVSFARGQTRGYYDSALVRFQYCVVLCCFVVFCFSFDWQDLSNTHESVWAYFQTLQSQKYFQYVPFFPLFSQYLEINVVKLGGETRLDWYPPIFIESKTIKIYSFDKSTAHMVRSVSLCLYLVYSTLSILY